MIGAYDEVGHAYAWKRMVVCFVCMFATWVICWVVSPWAAAIACFSNLVFLLGMFFWFRLYPNTKDVEDEIRRAHDHNGDDSH